MKQYQGWVLDVYPHPRSGIVIWLLCDDGIRRCFQQDFETAFYVRGPVHQLRELWRLLHPRYVGKEGLHKRRDLYDGPQPVLHVRVPSPNMLTEVFREAQEHFPDLIYYDVDIALSLRYAAVFDIFPLSRCTVTIENNRVTDIQPLDSRWDIDPQPPPLRKLFIQPNVDPHNSKPAFLNIKYEAFNYQVPLDNSRDLLFKINSILRSYNPDVILTHHGDGWLFSYLEKISKQTGIPFEPNRDVGREVIRKKPITFYTYGQAHYRGGQVHLLGRWHIDELNCTGNADNGLYGALEGARISGLPVQDAARRSAGAGISAMQVITALRRGVLVPFERQKGEEYTTYNDIFKEDQGGIQLRPLLGLFEHVFELDFFMMFPSIIDKYNISPETVGVNEPDAVQIDGLRLKVSKRRGLVPETLAPMAEKRRTIKRRLKTMKEDDPNYRRYKAAAGTIKNLGIVSNGRLGFANSIFGRLTAHQGLAALSRKFILQAKSIAEGHGFTVLQIVVDSLFLCREGASTPEDIQPVIDEIEAVTQLPIDREDIYSWTAFVPSRYKPNVPVLNRYFCLKRDGSFKVRGLAIRRKDTCSFVANLQQDALDILSGQNDPQQLSELVPEIVQMVKARCADLREGGVPLEDLIVTRKLSKELHEYKASSAMVRACKQLDAAGRLVRMGQTVRYIHTRGRGAYPIGLPKPFKPYMVSIPIYTELVLRAIHEVIQPLGVSESTLRGWMNGAAYISPSDWVLFPKQKSKLDLPLFIGNNSVKLIPGF